MAALLGKTSTFSAVPFGRFLASATDAFRLKDHSGWGSSTQYSIAITSLLLALSTFSHFLLFHKCFSELNP
jgi:hypothetical protein